MKYAKLLSFMAIALTGLESCKQENQSNISFDHDIRDAIAGANLSNEEIDDICSIHSLKIMVANAEPASVIDWSSKISDEDKIKLAKEKADGELAFEKIIRENLNAFIQTHSEKQSRCRPSHKTKTTILSIFDGPGGGNSEINLWEASFHGDAWKMADPKPYVFEVDGSNSHVIQRVGKFELNMATDVPVILGEFLHNYIKDYKQIEFFYTGHGAQAIVDANVPVNLFAEFRTEGRRNLLLLDTYGPKGPIFSDLYTPIWRKVTASKLCKENGSAAAESETCENIRTEVEQQVGFSGEQGVTSGDYDKRGSTNGANGNTSGNNGNTSGSNGNTSGNDGNTSGNDGNTSGKVYSATKPNIDLNGAVSASNPEGIARAGQAASYNMSGYNIVALDFRKLFERAKVPSLVVLNSCYQSGDIKKVLSKGFYVNLNPYPIYTWLVDFGSLNDFQYRALPFLLAKAEGNGIRTVLRQGISTGRVTGKGKVPSYCIKNQYCQMQTVSSGE